MLYYLQTSRGAFFLLLGWSKTGAKNWTQLGGHIHQSENHDVQSYKSYTMYKTRTIKINAYKKNFFGIIKSHITIKRIFRVNLWDSWFVCLNATFSYVFSSCYQQILL